MHTLLIACLGIAILARHAQAQADDYSRFVNPFIGGEGYIPGLAFGGGDIFVGGAVPFGVAKIGIDTFETNLSRSTINGGWTPRGLVTGISMMHESGTGGPPKYGIVSQMPLTTMAAPVNLLDNTTYWQARVGNDSASVGFFATRLESGVDVRLAGARHSGIIEYEFPADAEKHILVDVSHFLPDVSGSNEAQYYAGGSIQVQPGGRTYSGWGSYGGGFSDSAPSTTYFCAEFDSAPDQSATFRGSNTASVQRQRSLANAPIPQPTFNNNTSEESGPLNDRVGAIFSWSNSTTVTSKIGISFISVDKACAYKDSELPSWSIDDAVDAAVREWNQDVFSKIRVATDAS